MRRGNKQITGKPKQNKENTKVRSRNQICWNMLQKTASEHFWKMYVLCDDRIPVVQKEKGQTTEKVSIQLRESYTHPSLPAACARPGSNLTTTVHVVGPSLSAKSPTHGTAALTFDPTSGHPRAPTYHTPWLTFTKRVSYETIHRMVDLHHKAAT